MAQAIGSRLGPYEIVSLIGAGGMGEVYRARDSRLGRDVAVKILPESFARDAERLRRFEQEARTVAALNHPNILSIYDVGSFDGVPYLVSELLEGETLRSRLELGILQQRKAVEILAQVADGLAAAHDNGIIHRDIKPENIFISKDGRVKILDFGLAKFAASQTFAAAPDGLTAANISNTAAGVVLGTAGYMSPEQVRGQEVDARTDIFSFGAIAYEMLSGHRAFHRTSSIETMNAILKEEPEELDAENLHISPALDKIVTHCLEKEPRRRFQSARDLAFNLSALSHLSGTSVARAIPTSKIDLSPRRWLAAIILIVIVAAMAIFATMYLTNHRQFEFQSLTFRRGDVFNARFAPDKKTILYSAQWGDEPDEIYSTVSDSRESRSLGFGSTELLSVSSTGELAVLLKPQLAMAGFLRAGTLARVSMVAGTAPREIADNIVWADWNPEGTELAVVTASLANGFAIEYPIGKQIYKAPPAGWLGNIRISRKGDYIAFIEHFAFGDDGGRLKVILPDGTVKFSGDNNPGIQGLAWAPNGELWFTATPQGIASRQLIATTLSGNRRVLLIAPGELTLHDISSDGIALMTVNNRTRSIVAVIDGKERNLEWLDRSVFAALTPDGSMIGFHEGGKAGEDHGKMYLRKVDGSPALKLGDGYVSGISPDKKWVLGGYNITTPPELRLIPTGVGEFKKLSDPHIPNRQFVAFTADGSHLIFNGTTADGKLQSFLVDFTGNDVKPHTSPGTSVLGVATDGCCEIRKDDVGSFIWTSATGAVERLKDTTLTFVGGSADFSTLYAADRTAPTVKMFAIDRHSGARKPIGELVPHDPAGIMGINKIAVSDNGKVIVYGLTRELSDLYMTNRQK